MKNRLILTLLLILGIYVYNLADFNATNGIGIFNAIFFVLLCGFGLLYLMIEIED